MSVFENSMLFVQVVQAGSFTKAANRLASSKSKISRRIADLEQQLDATLFNRISRGLSLTEQGSHYYATCLEIQQSFDSAKDALQAKKESLSGHIAITAPMSLGSLFIGPLLGKFMRHHPNVRIELDLSDNPISLLDSHYDLAIRATAKLPDSSLYARTLHVYDYVVAASPEYLKRYGHPTHPSELEKHRAITCITQANAKLKTHWDFYVENKLLSVKINSIAQVTHMWVQKRFALDGLGIIRIPRYWLENEIQEGRLCSLLEAYLSDSSKLFALYKKSKSHQLGALIDYLATHLPKSLPG